MKSDYKYYDPKDVISPQRCVNSVTPLYDGGIDESFSLAIVNWQGKDCIGIRWNLTHGEWDDERKKNGSVICVGEPNSRGYPTWFILPDEFLSQIVNKESDIIEKIKKALLDINKLKKDE